MGVLARDIVLWLLEVRGHIPRFDDFRPMPEAPAGNAGNVMRAIAAIIAVFGALSLAVWATVWLAIQLL